jgi:hypothetical protein
MANSALSVSSTILAKQRPQTAFGNLALSDATNTARFDSTHDAIIVAGPNTVFRVQLIGGTWQVVTQRTLSIGSFDLSPDSRYIAYANGATIKTIDAVTLQDVASYSLPNMPGLPSYGYSNPSVLEILNNGSVLLGLYGPNSGILYTFQLTNQTLASTGQNLYRAMVRRDDSGSKAFIASNGFGGRTSNGFYLASDGSYVPETMPSGDIAGNYFALSGKGNRIWLNNNLYDASYTLLGTVNNDSSMYNYDAALSPDGRKAYLVRAGYGMIRTYDASTAPPYAVSGSDITFPAYSYYAAGPTSQVVPDGSMMILNGGWIDSGTREQHLMIIPLP